MHTYAYASPCLWMPMYHRGPQAPRPPPMFKGRTPNIYLDAGGVGVNVGARASTESRPLVQPHIEGHLRYHYGYALE